MTPSAIRAAWKLDRLDPDNYFVIPEFGVNPVGANLRGFRDPILWPGSKNRALDEQLREMVRAARSLARKTFPTLRELERAHEDAWGCIERGRRLTKKHETALQYKSFSGLMGIRLLPLDIVDRVVAWQAILLTKWAVFGPSQSEEELAAMLASRLAVAQKGGVASGDSRSQSSRDTKIVQAARGLGWPHTRGIPSLLVMRFQDVGVRRIQQVLREALQQENRARNELS